MPHAPLSSEVYGINNSDDSGRCFKPPPPPGLDLDFGMVDISNIDAITSVSLLNKLFNARKIGFVDYMRATIALRSTPAPSIEPDPITILYPKFSNPIISPGAVLQLLASPLSRSNQNTASLTIHRISDTMLVKFGPSVTFLEARTMLFVQEHTKIPVPAVHLVFVSGDKTYIVMDYISGGDLQYLWPTLQDLERRSVLSQLERYLCDLRSISPPSQTPGPIDGGICHGRWFSSLGAGPFESHDHLVSWWNSFRPPMTTADNDVTACDPLQADHPLVFTHGDLLPRNLIFHSGTVWIVDWELAGWYPAYLEYACIAEDVGDWEYPTPKDWTGAVLPLLPDYEREYRVLRSVQGALERAPFV